jgi:hypothetical protein
MAASDDLGSGRSDGGGRGAAGGGGGGGPGGSGGGAAPEPPAGRVITAALELSFRAVWLQLLTAGVGDGYTAAITDFCVACIAARKAGYTIRALQLELAANELSGDAPEIQIARLNEQEKGTRLIWIAIVFLTLQRYNFAAGSVPPGDDVLRSFKGTAVEDLARGLRSLVDNVSDAADKGYSLDTYKMELNLSRDPSIEPPSPATLSIQSQWSRIVFATYNLLPEALREPKRRKL